jgi:aspartyl-tRNA(Asn)/glutamyl-tRNA(Gln) amidotransferase subunit A
MHTLSSLASDLETGKTSSHSLVEQCLAQINEPSGEGRRTFLKVHAQRALDDAARHDRERRDGRALSRYAGIPISIKDLFDIAGDVTTAGSILLRDRAPAVRDAPAVARLLAAGFIPIGRTNMTEFAFSGLGLNAHYGTPANPYDRATGRIPGGSSSGAAISITDGMAFGALGTDTGGSCRIPAAMCGIVGFKPTASRVPLAGAFPLASSLDSIGSLASSVECCAILDALLAGEAVTSLALPSLAGRRFAVPQHVVLDGIDDDVSRAFERALTTLANQGAIIEEIGLAQLTELSQINSKGGLPPVEAYSVHRDLITAHASSYDPRVLIRILRGKEQDAADYSQLLRARADFIERVSAALSPFDAVLMPTVPMIAPTLASLADDAAYVRANALALRNPSIFNFIDGCAISVPCHEHDQAPVGLMLGGLNGADHKILAIAAAVERYVSPYAEPSG